MTLIFGSLFAGIGGFDLGFERAGMRCAWQVEIDDFCQQVLAKHWPDVPKFGDVHDVGKHNLRPVDIICGGFPCQPHSVAGKRKGADDDRDLWPEYRRIVDELRPTWVVAENVPGIRTTILDQVLSDLEGLDYATGTIGIPAAAFDAWHIRERYFIIAYNDAGFSKYALDSIRARRNPVDFSDQNNTGWATEPDVGRVVHGVPTRLDRIRRRQRIRGLGNAVVPQVAEFIGRLIVEIEGIAK